MVNKEKKEKKVLKRQNKNDLPVFDSDHDFLWAFIKKDEIKTKYQEENGIDSRKKKQINKHGIEVIDTLPGDRDFTESKETFSELLEESLKNRKVKPANKPSPMPVKKRLKRYPPVEVELDLHGYNTIGAQVKTRSFISSCKHQGFFTLRIIVGKGLHSDTGPVLPDVVEDVVKEMKKQGQVIFYEWDKKKKTRSGALIVYLKQFEQFE
ncbi:MAG: Smr/MutS family protein [Deltaproteobacteria bacterium]|uniref:Smr/MutS family protein n=1 Tax=Desulfobacula sp. TaxID=2593537 RepID=UPI0019AD0327|nr:Smr/MutS family protein [Candidatus Desulfobacula maris]MBL6996078.1 Smr/MutS family protein [Desulfobacula sp.]